jgi:hypothetical protein
MVRAFYEDRPEEDGSKVMRPTFVRRHVLFRVDEVDQLTAVAGRQGQTTLPLLRSAWSGEELGNSYASREKSLKVPSLQYRCAVVVGVQPTRAGELLDDTGGGTAQRVLWLLNGDPDAPDELPEWPGRLDVTVPRWDPDKATRSAGPRVTPLAVADSVAEEIRRHRRAVLRLAAESDHRDLQRLKVAALLAVLDGRLDVNGEDWSLAGIVLDTSDKVRDHIAQERARESEDEADRSGHRAGRRALAAQTVSEDVERIARLIWRHLGDGPLRPSVVKNQKVAHRDRPNFDAALKLARARGWVVDLGNGEVGQGAQPQERAA